MPLNIYEEGRTLVFGHRGASGYAPQNTLPAFELAVQQGVDGVEFDVHLSADGELVVIHDFDVDHTTDGHGEVAALTLAELKALDAGVKFDAKFAGARIPTLDEVFETLAGRIAVNVEIKAIAEEIEAKVADCIRRHNLTDKAIISSFNPLILHRFRAAAPDIAIGFLYYEETPAEFMQMMMGLPYEARHPHHPMIDRAYMEQAKRFGYRVNTWTVNDAARAVALQELGVDCIMTDTPDVMIKALNEA